jgi:hypothetical protein
MPKLTSSFAMFSFVPSCCMQILSLTLRSLFINYYNNLQLAVA